MPEVEHEQEAQERDSQEGKDTEQDKGDEKSLIKAVFPHSANLVFFTAIAVGVLLVALPTAFRSYFAVNGTHADLVLCVGAALVLAAFGGQATVRIGGVIMAGAAAIAIALFLYLEKNIDTNFMQGKITKYDRHAYKDLEVRNRNPFLGAATANQRNLKNSSFEFIAFKSQIVDSRVEINMTKTADGKEVSLFVNVEEIEWAFGNKQRLEWEFRDQVIDGEKQPGLYEISRGKGRFVTTDRTIEQIRSRIADASWSNIVGQTLAQEPGDGADVNIFIERLKSDDTVLRRGARDAL